MSERLRIVAALGGNALLRRGERVETRTQEANVRAAVRALAAIARAHELVVTHGNGPQVGLLALQTESFDGVAPYPLDVLDAGTEGMIGYLLDRELTNVLGGAPVATLLTQVVVDEEDLAFLAPSKPIGPVYDAATARRLATERGWTVARDGVRWRRVVPSPEPRALIELATIRLLLGAGAVVVCAGGGGIPVTVDHDGCLHGCEAVVDKDLAAALLARGIGADALLLLTDVAAVDAGWGTPSARPLGSITAARLRALHLAPGSMGPKAEAACRFAETGGFAAIGALADAAELLAGRCGTRVLA